MISSDVIAGPLDPWDPSHSGPFIDEVDEEDDVYEPEDYTGDYPLENDVPDEDCATIG
jgi:hypothetical protein